MRTTALDSHDKLFSSTPKGLEASLARAEVASKWHAASLVVDHSRLNLPLMLNRSTAETLTAQAIEESHRLEDLIRETLERYAGA